MVAEELGGNMLTLGEIVEELQKIQADYGSDAKVALTIVNEHNVYGNFATSVYCGKSGTVYIVGGSVEKEEE